MTTLAEDLEKGLAHQQAGDWALARDCYCAALRQDPLHPQAWRLLGQTALAADEPGTAVECLERAWPSFYQEASFHAELAQAHCQVKDYKGAEKSYKEALRLQPDTASWQAELARVLLDAGKIDESEKLARTLLENDPDHVELNLLMGAILAWRRQWTEGEKHYRRAIAQKPQQDDAHYSLGLVLRQQGRLREAISSMEEAVRLAPAKPEVHNNFGVLLQALGNDADALACYQNAARLKPDYVEAYHNAGGILFKLGRFREAFTALRRALELDPEMPEALTTLGLVLAAMGQIEEGMVYHRKARRRPVLSSASHADLLLALHYDPKVEPPMILEEHVRWAKTHARHEVPSYYPNLPEPEGRLRVGYVSPDFRAHPVTLFMKPVLANHDPTQIEVFCYAHEVRPDEATRELQKLVPHWRPITDLNDDEAAALIQRDGIDILVDLSGHTGWSRLLIFARKPAPIQATYLGYMSTTGLPTMDYRLTDPVADPPGESKRDTEELIHLEEGYACYAPPGVPPDVSALPALQKGFVTFGSPHNLAKLNVGVYDLWARILRVVPSSRLCVFRQQPMQGFREYLESQLVQRGVMRERIDVREIYASHDGYVNYLAVYNDIDICLNSFPAGAGTTCVEAMYMGVPWITLTGNRFYSRLTASYLHRVGLTEDWVARTADDYLALAQRWCADLPALAAVRAGLRQRVQEKLCDGPRFTRALEKAYRIMWQRWCQAQGK